MPQVEQKAQQLPLAIEVLREELALIDAQFDAITAASDMGERTAREADLLRAIDRYLRLESEVLHPVLARKHIDHDAAADSNARLRSAARELVSSDSGSSPAPLAGLRSSLRSHGQAQEKELFPRVAHALGDELPGLAVELQEVRDRMKGAFGV
jgi:hypothetical protein